MSLFTGWKSEGAPTCPRCRDASFVVKVREAEYHNIFDCRKCGPISPERIKQEPTRGRKRR